MEQPSVLFKDIMNSFYQYECCFSIYQISIYNPDTRIAYIGQQRKWVVLSDQFDEGFQSEYSREQYFKQVTNLRIMCIPQR